MRVRDLLSRLHAADPNAIVLWLPPWADASEADEICDVVLVAEPWACECHPTTDGQVSLSYYPAGHGHSLGYNLATDKEWPERVVILSSGPGGSRD